MIDNVVIKNIKVFKDGRGDFREILRLGGKLSKKIAQISISTTHPGVIKAFHWHRSQDDIFYVISGNVQLVLHDQRTASKTCGETQVVYLGESYKPQAILIPRGVYHGYKVLGNKDAQVLYVMDNQYNPSKPDEQRVDFDDKKIGFDWRDKVLVIGAGGFLGEQIMQDLSKDFQVMGTYYPEKNRGIYLDITDKKQVKKVLGKENPDIVILTAAKTDVEACEADPKGTYRANVLGVKNVVDSLTHQKIVFYSTEFVFDGKKHLYAEEDPPRAINTYGLSKLRAERIVSKYPNHLLCRTSRLYGANGNKFLNKMIGMFKRGKKIYAPSQTPGNFSLVEDVSCATLQLLKKGCGGLYHVAGKAESFDQAAIKIAEVFKFKKSLVYKVDRNFFNSKVRRPTCVLNTKKLEREGIKMSTLEQGLKKIKKQLLK